MTDNRIAELLNSPGSGSAPPPAPSTGGAQSSPSTGAPPPSSAPPVGGGKSSGEVRFSPDQLRNLGKAMETELEAIFKQARNKLNVKPRDAQPDAFTTFGFACAMVYTQVIEFADQDLITKTELAMDFNDRLQKTAAIQDEAERRSTINGGD